jgi:hypothetical protein
MEHVACVGEKRGRQNASVLAQKAQVGKYFSAIIIDVQHARALFRRHACAREGRAPEAPLNGKVFRGAASLTHAHTRAQMENWVSSFICSVLPAHLEFDPKALTAEVKFS